MERDLPSYVYKQYNKYCVQQEVNGKRKVYLRTKDKQEAIHYRNKLVQEGIITRRNTCQHRIKNYEDRYITKTPAGTYRNLQDAREERDYLESIDWDYSNMETVESLEYQENKEKWRRAINE